METNLQKIRRSREYSRAQIGLIIELSCIVGGTLVLGLLALCLGEENAEPGIRSICLFFMTIIDMVSAIFLAYHIYRVCCITRSPETYFFTEAQVINCEMEINRWRRRGITVVYLTLRFQKENGETDTQEIPHWVWWSEYFSLPMEEPLIIQIAYNSLTEELVTFAEVG